MRPTTSSNQQLAAPGILNLHKAGAVKSTHLNETEPEVSLPSHTCTGEQLTSFPVGDPQEAGHQCQNSARRAQAEHNPRLPGCVGEPKSIRGRAGELSVLLYLARRTWVYKDYLRCRPSHQNTKAAETWEPPGAWTAPRDPHPQAFLTATLHLSFPSFPQELPVPLATQKSLFLV